MLRLYGALRLLCEHLPASGKLTAPRSPGINAVLKSSPLEYRASLTSITAVGLWGLVYAPGQGSRCQPQGRLAAALCRPLAFQASTTPDRLIEKVATTSPPEICRPPPWFHERRNHNQSLDHRNNVHRISHVREGKCTVEVEQFCTCIGKNEWRKMPFDLP